MERRDINLLKITYVSGLIKTSEIEPFTRSLFRMTRGNIIIEQRSFTKEMMKDMASLSEGENLDNLTVFLLVLPVAGAEKALSRKVSQVCSTYNAQLITLPPSEAELEATVLALEKEYQDISTVRKRMADDFVDKLAYLAEIDEVESGQQEMLCSKIEEYKGSIRKYKAIFETLGHFKETTSLLVGAFWAPKSDHQQIFDKVDSLKAGDPYFITAKIIPVTHDKTPPTLFRTNSFTEPFQVIVETFSIPRYKEINPAVLTAITFPFLFGVMFGDVAHGLVLLLVGLAAGRPAFSRSKTLKPLFGLRYLLSLMGFFSVFSGLVYNDFMGVKMLLWRSCYSSEGEMLVRVPDCVYPVGFDHVWGFAKNEISYANSFKMKFSILIGFFQMMAGILFKGTRRSCRLERLVLRAVPGVLLRVPPPGHLHVLHLWLHELPYRAQVAQGVDHAVPFDHQHLHLHHLDGTLASPSPPSRSSKMQSARPRSKKPSSVASSSPSRGRNLLSDSALRQATACAPAVQEKVPQADHSRW